MRQQVLAPCHAYNMKSNMSIGEELLSGRQNIWSISGADFILSATEEHKPNNWVSPLHNTLHKWSGKTGYCSQVFVCFASQNLQTNQEFLYP